MYILFLIYVWPLLLATLAAKQAWHWFKNVQDANRSGIPVFKSPAHVSDVWWLAGYPSLLPLLSRLPDRWTRGWLPISKIFGLWHVGHAPFASAGADSFMLAAPSGNMMWTCDPEVVSQVAKQNGSFRKPVEEFGFFDIYGPNLQTSMGERMRFYRKIAAPSLGVDTNRVMWKAAVDESRKMVDICIRSPNPISLITDYLTELSLHTVMKSLFNKQLDWPGQNAGAEQETGQRTDFSSAVVTVVERLGILYAIPQRLRKMLPVAAVKSADRAYDDLRGHIEDIYEGGNSTTDGPTPENQVMNLKNALIAAMKSKTSDTHSWPLQKDELVGNFFFFILASFGTAANTMSLTLMLLAIRTDVQEKLHEELEQCFGQRSSSTWTFGEDFMALYNGYPGAVLKEAMRLYNVIEFIPRRAVKDTEVTDSQGQNFVVPAGTLCLTNYTAVFRHPRIWPASATSVDSTGRYHPALDFDPGRWSEKTFAPAEVGDKTYFPFGMGTRACMGKTLASVMMVGVLSYVFRYYSLELVPTEKIMKAAGDCHHGQDWVRERTREKALRRLLDDVGCNINVEMKRPFPMRFVRREPDVSAAEK